MIILVSSDLSSLVIACQFFFIFFYCFYFIFYSIEREKARKKKEEEEKKSEREREKVLYSLHADLTHVVFSWLSISYLYNDVMSRFFLHTSLGLVLVFFPLLQLRCRVRFLHFHEFLFYFVFLEIVSGENSNWKGAVRSKED